MLRALIVSTLFASQAYALETYNLSCETQKTLPKKAFQAQMTLQAEAWLMDNKDPKKEEIRLRDIVFSIKELDSENAAEVGRAKTIDAGINPRAKKYKAYYQASMDSLTDVKDFDRFMPIDQCSFTVMLPTNMWNKTRFEAPVVTHCDQNGGTQGMDCELTVRTKK